ncbi:hypothetical protein ILUMI_01423 [Ignelater luminosus]|uniref:Indole-3-acetaldehyde oxidase n=1 Tax=Ignelater luminosus TaxID=2038154 RepID=A0A8K0GP88_IGNLU|nr:hypothetical protein ILUMI_01423 [Ignelater luminosus]
MQKAKSVRFVLHNQNHTVTPSDVAPETTLLEYLRDYEHMKGTKYMCLEGGCGACVVSVTTKHPVTKRTITFAVNSCLVSVYSCEGWHIQTVDGIGNNQIGYHPVQKVLAEFNGTQCGFCSPGMVMNMYALYESNNNLTMKEVETSFGGNMCRCTGYRPILTAFKSLAKDADKEILGEYPDIEDLNVCDTANCQRICQTMCKRKSVSTALHLSSSNSKWFKVFSINEIFDVLKANPNKSYQLVAGNTARGVYHDFNGHPKLYIDITSVKNLLVDVVTADNLMVGANKSLTEAMELFQNTAETNGFDYLAKLADHIKLVAHVPVRNIGTLAGNLSIKHERNEFPSDIFLIFETVGAKMTIVNANKTEKVRDLLSYLTLDMKNKVIKNFILPKLSKSYKYQSYKIMPRAQNAHAMVNAGFLLKLDEHEVVQSIRIVYGGINSSFVHATKAEKYLVGKSIFDNNTLQGAFKALDEELQPDDALPEPSPLFRKKLAIALFYKFVLSITPSNKVSPENKSGGQLLQRPVSTGVQDFQTNQSLYPLTEAIPKLEALGQTSGEIEYISDLPNSVDQLFACFVTAKAPANYTIANIDTSEALKEDGVISFFGAKDILGPNSFVPSNTNYPEGFIPPGLHLVPEEVFCSGTVKYYFQPVGIIVAKTQELAERAADLVKVTYNPSTKKPLLTVREVLAANDPNRVSEEASMKATSKGNDVKHIIKGRYDMTPQYHYHMETQICCVIPNEGNLDIYPGTQWMDIIQTSVASILKIKENRINIKVKRVGGAFGAKITRNAQVACAAALAAHKLQKPVKMRLSFTANMDVVGKRYQTASDYEVGLNDKGEIQYLNDKFYFDYATGGNEPIIAFCIPAISSSYKHDTWDITGYYTNTDNAPGVWMRAPGHANVVAMSETIMEHIALEMGKPALEIRLANMSQNENKKLIQFINELRQTSDYDNRLKAAEEFNKTNRWMKKGLSLVPMTFPFVYVGGLNSIVAIYAGDGSVAVSHGGIEIGQGINTKVAQVCAYALKIPLNMVSVKASNNLVSPNNTLTGASLTSECVCYATLKACEILTARMKPVKDKMKNPTWEELVKECQKEYVELVATYMYSPNEPPQAYDIYGVCITEVEVDILTGIHQITRVDILEDTGTSMSPLIDIGQVEGAFIIGLGLWTTEKIVLDKEGRLLTNRTWNYKIPCALDIPIDFRVRFPKNNPNSVGVLNSKTTGEPALCLACSIPCAIRQAVASARSAADPKASKWYPFSGPSDVENTFLNSLNDCKQYTL